MSNLTPVSHGDVAATGAVTTGNGALVGVVLSPAAANSTLTLHDNTAASGTVLCILSAPANGPSAQFTPSHPIAYRIGIYATITGASANATVVYW